LDIEIANLLSCFKALCISTLFLTAIWPQTMVRPALGVSRPGRTVGATRILGFDAMSKPPRRGTGSVQPSADKGDLDRRRRGLDSGLRSARERHAPVPESPMRGQALAMGFRIAVEMLAALLVGGVIGWLLDAWLGTAPILFLLFLALGAAAGLRSIIQHAYRMNRLAQGLENDSEARPGEGPDRR
jgi:ATP synthase protein I